MTDVKTELRNEFMTVLGAATYPVADPVELIPILPDGAATEFRAGEVVIPVIELGTTYGEYQDFPYEAVEPLVADIMAGLEAEGTI